MTDYKMVEEEVREWGEEKVPDEVAANFEIRIDEKDLEIIHAALKYYYANAEQELVDYTLNLDREIIKDKITYFYGKMMDYRNSIR